MSTREQLRLQIALDRGANPVTGSVTAGAMERTFAGWTELFAAMQAAIADDPQEGQPDAKDL